VKDITKRWTAVTRLFRIIGGIAAVAVFVTGCATRLQIVTEPPGAHVTLANSKGKTIASGPSPLVAKVSFSGSNPQYELNVTGPSDVGDKYLPGSTNITQPVFKALPPYDGNNSRRLDVKLEERLFLTLPYVEIVLDSKHNWRGAIIGSRAYKDVGETGGAVPTRIRSLADSAAIQGIALSPDGNRIVYSEAALPSIDFQKAFVTVDARGVDIIGANLNSISINAGGVEHITSENFRDMFPSFSSDGQKLLFTSNRRRSGSEDILLISAVRRSGISDVYVHRDARMLRPTQAADDSTIAFCVEEPNPVDVKQRFTIWTLGGPNQFPTQIQVGSQPAISPDGKRIAYIGPDANLWVVNTDGALPTQLTFGAEKVLERYRANLSPKELQRFEAFVREYGSAEKMPFSLPSWSKDGRRIVYTAMEGSDSTGRPNEDIWIMDYDGSNRRQLTTNGSIDRYPLLSPDGKWVYFMSNRGGHWAIWRIPTQEETSSTGK